MGGSFALGVVGPTDAGPTEESHCPWVSSAPFTQSTTADNERLTFDGTPLPSHPGAWVTSGATQGRNGLPARPREFAGADKLLHRRRQKLLVTQCIWMRMLVIRPVERDGG
jgi:hypothetical protein